MGKKAYTATFTVSDYDVNMFLNLHLRRVLQWMNQTMREQDRALDRPFSLDGNTWVYIEQDIKIHRWPKLGESIRISTRPDFFNSMYGSRLFEIRDQKGELIIENWGLYCLMDLETRSLQRIKREFVEQMKEDWGVPSDARPLKRTKLPEWPKEAEERTITAGFSTLDSNGHVNNTAYMDWLVDSMPFQTHKEWEMSQVTIQYLKEVLPDTRVTISHTPIELHTESGEGENYFRLMSEGNLHATIRVKWRKK